MKLSLVCGLLAAVSVGALSVGSPSMAQDAAVPNLALAAKGAWSASTTYAKDDIVTARGSAWRALKSSKGKVPGSTDPNNATYWEAFSVGLNPTGAWSSSHTYQPNELATYNGQTWRAKLTHSNVAPVASSRWELVVTKGATGAHGATGATGPQGPAGPNTGVTHGTITAPGISFSGDSNTGIYSPGSNKIALVEGGTLFLHNIGTKNTGLGVGALKSVSNGVSNTAMGDGALLSGTSVSETSAFGTSALQNLTVGDRNTAVGAQALTTITSGSENTAVGAYTMKNITSGNENVAVGSFAMSSNSTGDQNVAVGRATLYGNAAGSHNVAVGYSALLGGTGSNNTAIGYTAAAVTTTGSDNVVVGGGAALNSNASRNTVVGADALSTNTTGTDNIAIGYRAGKQAPVDVTNSIYIGNDGTSTGSNTTIIGNGSTTTVFMGGISGVTSTGGAAVYINSSGQFGTATSSRRFKQDIEPVTRQAALLDRMQPVSFRYKEADTDGSKPLQYGLIAEDVEAISRDLVIYDKDGKIQTVKYHFLPPLLLAGYQAQQKEIAALKERVAATEALEARVRRLEALISQTKAAALQ